MDFALLRKGEQLTVIWILLALLLLCALVFVHELGHFLAGKALDFGIKEFSIGFGPKLFSRIGKDGIRYSLRALPLGGYCAFQDEDADGAEEDSFNNKAPWKRLIVMLAGVTFNFAFAFLLSIIFVGAFGVAGNLVRVVSLTPDGLASQIGIQSEDMITSVDGQTANLENIGTLLSEAAMDQQLQLGVERAGQVIEFDIPPSMLSGDKITLGIMISPNVVKPGFWGSIGEGAKLTGEMSGQILKSIGFLFTNPSSVGEQMMGPIGTVSSMGSMMREGFTGSSSSASTSSTEGASTASTGGAAQGIQMLLLLSILLSANLAVFNLLPIPGLDGGRIVFTLIEMIARKPVPQKWQAAINFAGILLFFVLAIYLSMKDVGRIVTGP